MDVFSFKQYAPSLSDKSKAEAGLVEIRNLNPKQNQIIVDFDGLIAMTTICARIIFGRLYKDLGKDLFYNNIKMKNIEESIRIVIKWGIMKELEQSDDLLNVSNE